MARAVTDLIIVHCSATPPTMDIGAKEIDRWHRARSFLKIGYHYVIRRDGTVEPGRGLEEPGAHARGYNSRSVGVCLVGGVAEDKKTPENNYTTEQMEALEILLQGLRAEYPDAKIIGHNEVNSHKACPCFDVQDWKSETDL
ncbi:N-acetylmuramoyl-L-alanine amidase [Desulfovibrio oxyclinae]|uniref:N-acetylmuramoyl-L-alanine amidase n=1 Tax=Desulfovibrio oxyclinae TaxID=63560 RepID=UPI00037DBB61|nr:N-acetylmuramoyl-L-alanine amidase [Desulfovibrio oxyclinae]